MDFGNLVGVIAGMLAYVAIGVVLRVSGVLKPEDARPLNAVLLYVALPALIFTTVHGADLDLHFAALPAIGWLVALLGAGSAWAFAKAFRITGPTAGAFILVATFGNTAYIGYPVASALLGDAGLVRAIFSDIFGNTAAVIIVGTLIASHYGEHDIEVNTLREVVTFPPFIALATALALHRVEVPVPVGDWLGALGKLVVPLIMVSVGLSLRAAGLKANLSKVSVVVGMKLVALPLLAFGVASLVLSDDASVRIAMLEAGVPSMMFTVILGARFNLDMDLVAAAILATTALSALSIPLLQLLVG